MLSMLEYLSLYLCDRILVQLVHKPEHNKGFLHNPLEKIKEISKIPCMTIEYSSNLLIAQ